MFRRELEKILEEKLKAFSFKKKKGQFVKIVDNKIVYTILFAFSTHGEKGTYYAAPDVRIAFKEIDSLINRLRNDCEEVSYCLATHIGYLMIHKGYKEWRVAKEDDLDKETDVIIQKTIEYGFPFFKKMSDIKNFAEAFINHDYSSSDYSDEFVLPAYYYLNNEKERGVQIVKEAIKRRSEIENKHYIESYQVFADNYMKLVNGEL